MDSSGKNMTITTPVKSTPPSRSKIPGSPKFSENVNPNVKISGSRSSISPAIKSAKSQKLATFVINHIHASPRRRIRERKFFVAKKQPREGRVGVSDFACKCREVNRGNALKCACVAYENLRASQEDFFKNREEQSHSDGDDYAEQTNRGAGEEEAEIHEIVTQTPDMETVSEPKTDIEDSSSPQSEMFDSETELGSSTIKRTRDRLMEEARCSGPEPGSGRVKHLVEAFERVLSVRSNESEQDDAKELEDIKRGLKWALPGMQSNIPASQESLSSFCPSDLFLTSENLGLDSQVSSSWDSGHRRNHRSRRSRRNSSESSGTMGRWRWKRKQLKKTTHKPFRLITEQRGRLKEEEFIQKVQEMMADEQRKRIPIAQGLPWTTDEPECLIKPPVKECTKPADVKLHSDVRAVERAEFDQQVVEKLSLIEQYKMERERQQKLEEEEEIRKLRKELVPKAQPMPYFDRPFIPRRSSKHPTIPKEPRFHVPRHKKLKCCVSLNDISIYDRVESTGCYSHEL